MANIGYARVSIRDQDLALQLDALPKAGCQERDIYTDKASGKLTGRPGPDDCLAALRPGDVLTVWKPDHLGHSLIHLVTRVTELGSRGIGFRSLTEGFDTPQTAGSWSSISSPLWPSSSARSSQSASGRGWRLPRRAARRARPARGAIR